MPCCWGCRVVSVCHLLVDVDVYLDRVVCLRHLFNDVVVAQGVIAPVDSGSGWGAARETRSDSACFRNEAPLNAPVPIVQWHEGLARATGRVPSGRSSQLRAAERCPGKKDLNTPAAGLARTRDLNTPCTGPRCLQRATSNPQRQHSLLSDQTSSPGLRETPRFLRRETLEKPDNEDIVAQPDAENKGFGSPAAQSVQFISIKFNRSLLTPLPTPTARPTPVIFATTRRSAPGEAVRAWPSGPARPPAPSLAS